MTGGEQTRFDWRRGVAAFVALFVTLMLLFMIWLVNASNEGRELAQQRERHAYDVTLLTRTLDSSISSAEAALGRYVLDEQQQTGTIYYSEWRLAQQQLGELERLVSRNPEQRARVEELRSLFDRRDVELSAAALAATAQQGNDAIGLFYQAGLSDTDEQLTRQLREIARAERDDLTQSIERTSVFSARADKLTDYLGYLGALVAAIAFGMGYFALRTFNQFLASRRETEVETKRADALETAVAERTAELWEANQALKEEAEERAAAEAQLRQVQKMEAVGQLTGGIAHDFNNMLAVVVGGLDLARRRIDGPRRELLTHLNNSMEGANRAATLTRRLLSFSRHEPLHPERVESSALVQSMRDLLDRTLGERISINIDLESEAWPVFVDAHQLENAILNLAVNARDAMEGKGELTIRTDNVTVDNADVGDIQAGDYLKISVIDTGCGMSEEVRRRAFEPFFTTKEVGKGTGLGLSQIFGFAHQSGGEVGIESTLGEGTQVALYLPRTHADAGTVALHPTAKTTASIDPMLAAEARILIVEDDPRVRAATEGALEDLGYEPHSVDSGAAALECFTPGAWDLVITDVIMPEMTGPELVRELRQRQADVAVLFVTGYVGEGDTDELAGHEVLRKPFTVNALANAVGTALANVDFGGSSAAAS